LVIGDNFIFGDSNYHKSFLFQQDVPDYVILEIVFLGTGASVPSKERSLPCVAVRRESDITLFDCGEGSQRQLMISSLSFMKIERVFLSHLHGDHILGLPGLIQTMSLNGRDRVLKVYGPMGTVEAVKSMMDLCHGEPTFQTIVQDLQDGDIVEASGFHIEACASEHSIDSLSYIYRESSKPGRLQKEKAIALGIPEGPLFSLIQKGESVRIGDKIIQPNEVCGSERLGRSISYSGDTLPSKTFQQRSRKVDVMIHEATFSDSEKELALKHYHSTASQAAKIASGAEVGQLILTHISSRYKDSKQLLIEAEKEFSSTHLADDFFSTIIKLK